MAETQTPPVEDEFSKMFDELAALGDKESAPAPEPEPEPVEPEPVVAEAAPAPVEPEPVVAEAAPAPVEPEPVVAEAPPAPAAPPRASDDDILARFAQALATQQPPAPAPPAPVVEPAPALFTDDEQKLLAAYEKDWPDVAKAEALRRRAEYQQLVGYMFNQIGQHLAQRLSPLEQTVQGGAQRSHISDLHNLIPDYDSVRQPVIDWVGKQPGYLKAAFEQVVRQGTPDEVADLVGRYKAASGIQPAPVAPAAPAAPAPALRKAAAALAPVRSSRSGSVPSTEPEDFDGAFEMAAKGL